MAVTMGERKKSYRFCIYRLVPFVAILSREASIRRLVDREAKHSRARRRQSPIFPSVLVVAHRLKLARQGCCVFPCPLHRAKPRAFDGCGAYTRGGGGYNSIRYTVLHQSLIILAGREGQNIEWKRGDSLNACFFASCYCMLRFLPYYDMEQQLQMSAYVVTVLQFQLQLSGSKVF